MSYSESDIEGNTYETDNVLPEIVPGHDFVVYDSAQVGTIVVQNMAELQCAYLHALGPEIKPDLETVDAFFKQV